jgi:hypothetical protein
LEIDGVEAEVPCDLGWWTYQRLPVDGVDTPAIVFEPDHVPPAGSRIAIRYLYGRGDEEFGGGGS